MSGRCTIREDGQACDRPPAYVIVFADCRACQLVTGWLFCPGHPACIEHTAETRGDLFDWDLAKLPDGPRPELEGPVVPVRVSSREVPA